MALRPIADVYFSPLDAAQRYQSVDVELLHGKGPRIVSYVLFDENLALHLATKITVKADDVRKYKQRFVDAFDVNQRCLQKNGRLPTLTGLGTIIQPQVFYHPYWTKKEGKYLLDHRQIISWFEADYVFILDETQEARDWVAQKADHPSKLDKLVQPFMDIFTTPDPLVIEQFTKELTWIKNDKNLPDPTEKLKERIRQIKGFSPLVLPKIQQELAGKFKVSL